MLAGRSARWVIEGAIATFIRLQHFIQRLAVVLLRELVLALAGLCELGLRLLPRVVALGGVLDSSAGHEAGRHAGGG